MANWAEQYDSATQLKDAGLIASSAAAQVSGADKILDLGADSMVKGVVVFDVTALEVASGDEVYFLEWQLSSSASFASGVVVSSILRIGDSSVAFGSADNTTGRYRLMVHNEFAGTLYRYARLYTRVVGTIATGINYSAYLSPLPMG